MQRAKAKEEEAAEVVRSNRYVKDEFKEDIKAAVSAQYGDPEIEAKENLFTWLKGIGRFDTYGLNVRWPSFCNKPIEEWDAVFVKYFTEDGLRAAKEIYEKFLRKNLIKWMSPLSHNDLYYGPDKGWPSFCNKPIEEWNENVRTLFKEDVLLAAKNRYNKFLRKNLINWMIMQREKADQETLYGPNRGWPSFCNKPIKEWDDIGTYDIGTFDDDLLQDAKAAYNKYHSLTGGKRRKRTKFNKRKSSSRVLSKSRRRTHRK
jgi:hypothetical protein